MLTPSQWPRPERVNPGRQKRLSGQCKLRIGLLLFVATLFVRQASGAGVHLTASKKTRLAVWTRHLLPRGGNLQDDYKAVKAMLDTEWPEIPDTARKGARHWKDVLNDDTHHLAPAIKKVLLVYFKCTKSEYTQGMQQLAMLLFDIFNNEAETFWALHELLETRGLHKKIWSEKTLNPRHANNVFKKFIETADTDLGKPQLEHLAVLVGMAYISCGYMVYNRIVETGTFRSDITYRVWDMIITKPDGLNGYDFMVKFATELLRIAVTHHESENPMEYFRHASQLLYTDEEYETAFRNCVPPRNNAPSGCQMPECSNTFRQFCWFQWRRTGRHHCRRCGKSICGPCSRFPTKKQHREDRFCTECSGEVPRVPNTKSNPKEIRTANE